MNSQEQFAAFEFMCRARASLAEKEMEYWLAEAEEWKQASHHTPATASPIRQTIRGADQLNRMVPMARQPTPSSADAQVDDIAAFYSDDECVQRLAALLEHKDSRTLEETARLISRLAVPIE
jgi:hypothetical protein